jgi:cyclohexanone monooxygenase
MQVASNRAANEAACEFIRKKIGQIVKDPEKARKLQPRDYYARRPLCDGGYYQQYNRENVHIVDLNETSISSFTAEGIATSDDNEYKLDLVIFATGFDAIDGNYTRLRIRGVEGQTLKNHWETGPTSYLGTSVPKFPNMFMITGPQSPFCNIPPAIEVHVEFISEIIRKAEEQAAESKRVLVEATPEAEAEWMQICDNAVEGSLFKETASWIFGANIPGKKVATRFYFGGLKAFRAELQRVSDNEYRGFKPLTAS